MKNFKIKLGHVVLALVLMFVATVSAHAYTYTTKLMQGSHGQAVMDLQTALGVKPVDGSFGPMTKAAVMSFQSAHSLTADGIVGPMTGAAIAGGATGGTYPAGCTSNTGYSTTTGQSCASTGNFPAGCTSAVGFSSTTGAKCDGTTVGGGSGPLMGGAGTVKAIKEFTSGVDTTITEGQTTGVLGVEVEADKDADLAVNSMRVTFTHSGDGSNRLNNYTGEVSVWNGSTKVGSAMATDFSRTGEESTKSIALSNVIVKMGTKVRLTVKIEANDSISGSGTSSQNDIGADWNVELISVRYTDPTGIVMDTNDFSTIDSDFTFEDSATNDDLKLQSSSSSPTAATVQVDENNETADVMLLAFKLKDATDSSDMNVLTIPVNVDVTDPTGGSSTTDEKVITDMYLKVGDTVYDNYELDNNDTVNNATSTAVYTFTIDEGDMVVAAGKTVEVKVYAKLGKQDGYYDEQTVLAVSVAKADVEAENKAGDSITLTGSDVNGENQTLRVNGADIVYVSSTSAASNQDNTSRDFTLVFDVTAVGQDLTVDRTDVDSSSTVGVQYSVSGAVDVNSPVLSSTASLNGDIYTVYAGQTKRFTLTVNLGTAATGQKKIILEKVGGIPTTTTIESVSATVIQ